MTSRYQKVEMRALGEVRGVEDIHEALFEWNDETARLNPDVCLPFGVKKQWYHFFKREHLYTTLYNAYIPAKYKKP
jgi:hypothetical protein